MAKKQPKLREEISVEVEKALRNTPYVANDEAHRLCRIFCIGTMPQMSEKSSDVMQTLPCPFKSSSAWITRSSPDDGVCQYGLYQ